MKSEIRFELSPGIVVETVDDEAILLNAEEDVFFGLNPVGYTIVTFMTDGSTVGEIIEQITTEFEVEPKEAEVDVREFLESLLEAELISETK